MNDTSQISERGTGVVSDLLPDFPRPSTPGPWIPSIGTRRGMVIVDDGPPLAVIDEDQGRYTSELTIRNTQAIAALPDLHNAYEAAREMVEEVREQRRVAYEACGWSHLLERRDRDLRAIAERHGLTTEAAGEEQT